MALMEQADAVSDGRGQIVGILAQHQTPAVCRFEESHKDIDQGGLALAVFPSRPQMEPWGTEKLRSR